MAALLALASCILISRCWDAPFYLLDDRDQMLPGLEQSFSEMLSSPRPGCFPVTAVSFRLDYLLFGTSKSLPPRKAFEQPESAAWAAGSRVLNAFYHFLAALLLYWFLLRLKSGPGIAAFVALGWAVHPISCESVCWIAERKTVLVALLGFGALVAWTFDGKIWRWPLVGILFALSMLCKSSALGLLPVFFVLDLALSERQWREPKFWLLRAAHLALPVLISLGGLYFARRVYPWDILVDPPGGSIWTALLTDVVLGARYLFNALLPVNLSFFYAVTPVVSLADGRLWACLIAIVAGFGLLLWLTLPARRYLTVFGLLWFVGALGPNCNLIAQTFVFQDRFIYLSIPGLLLAVALAFEGVVEHWKIAEPMRLFPGAAFMLFLSFMAVVRSQVYISDSLLAMDAAKSNPTSGYAQWRAGLALKNMTIQSMPGGPAADPKLVELYANLAQQHFDAAANCPDIGYFTNAFELKTTQAQMQLMLGQYAQVRETLNGWVPPPGMTQLPDDPHDAQKMGYKRTASTPFYRGETLRFAWSLLGELSLRESTVPGLQPEQQAAKCRQGLDAVAKALAMKADPVTQMLKARLLLRLSNIEIAQQKMELARTDYDDAAAILKSIPAESNLAATAGMMLEKIPRP